MKNLEPELRAALRARAPSEDEKTAWAHRACDVPDSSRRALLGPLTWAAAAVALLAVGIWAWKQTDGDVSPERTVYAGDGEAEGEKPVVRQPLDVTTTDEQRAIHDRFLANDKSSRSLREGKPGRYALLAGRGEDLNLWTGPDPEALLKRCARTWPEAPHRYFFKIGPQTFPSNTIIVPTSRVKPGIGGAMFLQELGLKVETTKSGATTLRLGKNSVTASSVHLELMVGKNGTKHRFEISKSSFATLVIPDALCDPQFEIPGTIILTNEQGVWLKHRRYFLRVRHGGLGLNRFVECAGRPDAVALDLNGYIWHKLKRAEVDEAKDAPRGQLLLVLEVPAAQAGAARMAFRAFKPGKDDDGPLDNVRHVWKPGKQFQLRRYTTDGRLIAQLDLTQVDTVTAKIMRKFLGPGGAGHKRR